MRGTARIALVLALVLGLGLHWTLLQMAAWTGMVLNYSRDHSLSTAVTMTFSGRHPCPLCTVVKAGRAAEKQRDQESAGSRFRLEATWEQPSAALADHRNGWLPTSFQPARSSRAEAPPKPRPRLPLGRPVS